MSSKNKDVLLWRYFFYQSWSCGRIMTQIIPLYVAVAELTTPIQKNTFNNLFSFAESRNQNIYIYI